MIKNLKKILIGASLAIVASTMLTSCEDKYYETVYVGNDMFTQSILVRANNWRWDEDYARYYFVADAPRLTSNVYIYGAVVGAVEVIEDTYDDYGRPNGTIKTMKGLPFVHTWFDQYGPYEETISFDYEPGYVTFFIQSSEGDRHTAVPVEYTFKMSYFYN